MAMPEYLEDVISSKVSDNKLRVLKSGLALQKEAN